MGLTTAGLVNGGETTYFSISYDTSLADGDGKSVAQALMNVCDADYALLAGWFAGTEFKFSLPVKVQLVVGDNGGGWDDPADWKNIFGYQPTVTVGASGSAASGLEFVRFVIVSEVSEMFMASKDNGWYEHTSLFKGGNEGSKGEGLSRFLGDQLALQLGKTSGFAGYDVVDQWLNLTARPNFVDNNPDDHGFDQVTGCTTCFIHYLHSQLGYSITDIINAGSPTLGGVYQKLTGRTGGGQSFIDLVNLHYPGTGYDVPANNIFPVANLHWVDSTTRLTAGADGQVFVTLDRATPVDISLSLASDDPTVVTVPASWTISAGTQDSLVDVQAQPVPGAQRSVAIHVSYAGQTLSAPVTVLPRPSIIQGVVRDGATQVRLPNAVVVVDDGDISGHEHMQLLTGSDGSYTTPPLPPNTYQVEVTASGYVGQSAFPVVKAGVPTAAANFELVKTVPSQVYGVVSDGSGSPVAGAALTLQKNGDDYRQFIAQSGDGGIYSLTVDPGSYVGGYMLSASHAGYVGTSVNFTIPNGSNLRHDLVLPELGSLSGLIADASGPVAGAEVQAGTLAASSDATGQYQLQSPPGPVVVTVRASGFETSTVTVTVVPGGVVDQDFVLVPASAALSGTVFDGDLGEGNPLPGAVISVAGAPSRPAAGVDGSYTVTRIPAGPARVTVSARGFVTQEATYTFTAGQTISLSFYLMHPGPIK